MNAGIVITGGTALLANMVEMAEQIFDMPVRIGYPRGVSGRVEEIDSPRCTTAVGLVLYGSQTIGGKTKGSAKVVENLKRIFKKLV